MLTTVSLRQDSLHIGEWLLAHIDPAITVVARSAIIPPGQSEQDVTTLTVTQMRESQVAAAAAALRLLGRPVVITYSGVRVIGIATDGPSKGVLQNGDLINLVDGTPVKRPPDLIRAIHRHTVGQKVRLRITRGTKAIDLTVGTIGRPQNKKDPIIGVIVDSVPQVKLPVPVSIDAQGIGGPSAGLLFALGIVDLVGNSDLTKGRFIAGTGEIDFDGTVGAVGGVRQKIEGARRAHAVLFLAPTDELKEACSAAKGLNVIGVDNLKQAVLALQGGRLPAGRYCS
jgi:PDZ domain-containing protein